jgi:hypothetical protein
MRSAQEQGMDAPDRKIEGGFDWRTDLGRAK